MRIFTIFALAVGFEQMVPGAMRPSKTLSGEAGRARDAGGSLHLAKWTGSSSRTVVKNALVRRKVLLHDSPKTAG